MTYEDFLDKRGIVFIQNGWGGTDHIDLWNGTSCVMKGGSRDYFSRGRAVWFWELGLFGGIPTPPFMIEFNANTPLLNL